MNGTSPHVLALGPQATKVREKQGSSTRLDGMALPCCSGRHRSSWCLYHAGSCLSSAGAAGQAQQLYDWEFSVFELDKHTRGRPLYHVCMALLEDHGLLDGWRLDRQVVAAYFSEVEARYKANPYHNNIHAADVTQTAGVITKAVSRLLNLPLSGSCCPYCGSIAASKNGKALAAAPAGEGGGSAGGDSGSGGGSGLSKLEVFAIILASAVHDLGHPGVNNAFLVKTRSSQALTYNDRSVNENMHASLAFQLAAQGPDTDIFANFSPAEYEQLRKLVVDMVLSTDMDVHFKLLRKYQKQLAAEPDVRKWATLPLRSLLFQMVVHLADLANPSRPWALALKWAEQVVTEFFGQGAQEAAANIPVSPFCDKTKACMPVAQLGFIDNFMAPTLELMRSAAPAFYHMAAAWLGDTQRKWRAFRDAGVKHPHQDYPQLPTPTAAEQAKLWTVLGDGCHCCSTCSPAAQQQCKPQGSEPQQQHQAASALQQPAQQQAAQAAG